MKVWVTGLLAFGLTAPGAPARSQLSSDTRLEQKLTIQAEGVRVGKLLERVSTITGVPIAAANDFENTKLVLLAKSQPAVEILASIAELLDGEWRAEGNQGKTWMLRPAPGSKNRNAKFIRMEEEKTLAKFERQTSLSSFSQEQIDKLPPSDERIQFARRAPARLSGLLYQSLTNDQKRQLLREGRFRMRFEQLAPGMRQALPSAIRASYAEETKRSGGEIQPQVLEGIDEGLKRQPLDLAINQMDDQLYLSLGYAKGSSYSIAMIPTDQQWAVPAHGRPYDGQLVDSSLLPLAADILGSLDHKELIQRLKSVHTKTGMTIVSDHYISRALKPTNRYIPSFTASPSSVEVLDRLCLTAGYCWWNRGRNLLFRKRDWYVQEQAEPPFEWYQSLLARTSKETYIPSTQDALEFSKLSPTQLAGNLSPGAHWRTGLPLHMAGVPSLLAAVAGTRLLTSGANPSGFKRHGESEVAEGSVLVYRPQEIVNVVQYLQRNPRIESPPDNPQFTLTAYFEYRGSDPGLEGVEHDHHITFGVQSNEWFCGLTLRIPSSKPSDAEDRMVVTAG